MPHFFFHLRSGDRYAIDAEGSMHPDLAAARADALAAARQILAERLKDGLPPGEITIEVTDDGGRSVDVIAVAVALRVRFPLGEEADGRTPIIFK